MKFVTCTLMLSVSTITLSQSATHTPVGQKGWRAIGMKVGENRHRRSTLLWVQ
jgi:hypothetical protein